METIEERSARNKAYYAANRANILAHKDAHREEINASRRLRLGMKTKAEYLAAVSKPRRHHINMRRIYAAVRNAIVYHPKSKRHSKVLACSPADFRRHIASQFKPGWSWENYGDLWECDHIAPLGSFDLTIESQVLKAAHFSNVRPIEPENNRLRCFSRNDCAGIAT